MDKPILELIQNYFNALVQYFQENGLLELGIALASILGAYLLYHIILRYINRWTRKKETSAVVSGYKWLKRVLFPGILFITLISVQAILQKLHVNAHLLGVMAPLALSLAAARLLVYFLRKVLSPGPILKTFENVIAGTIWIMVSLYLLGWLDEVSVLLDSLAFRLGDNRISMLSVIKLFLALSFFWIIALYVSGLIERKIKAASTSLPVNIQVGTLKVTKLGLYIFAVLLAMNAVGIDLTVFTVLGGAIGVGIGFGLQRIASNYISGFILIIDRSIKPGDVISIGNHFGFVESLNGRYVVVKDRDGVETLIPNETLVTNQVINWSYGDKKIRVKIPVQISYKDDPRQCLELVQSCAFVSPRVIKDPPPVARLIEFGNNGISLELRVWIEDPENGIEEVKTSIYLAIWDKFKENNITIPFPQRDIHIKNN